MVSIEDMTVGTLTWNPGKFIPTYFTVFSSLFKVYVIFGLVTLNV